MIHYGDIKTLSGSTLPPMDVIIGGSPCQDLSVAGKRAGLAGERSNLFLEQIRIVKEMQDATDGVYPRYMVWENVPGALSSNRGEDFRRVLQEIVCIKENRLIPRPEKWRTSGCILGDGYSVAWRILDAQFWGVPQRRRRIALVADFAGQSAPEILFIRRGLQGNPPQAEKAGKAGAGTADPGAGTAIYGMRQNNSADARSDGIQRDTAPTLKADHSGLVAALDARTKIGLVGEKLPTIRAESHGVPGTVLVLDNHPNDGRIGIIENGHAQALSARAGTGGNNGPLVLCIGAGREKQSVTEESSTLMGEGHGGPPVLCISRNVADRNARCNGAMVAEDTSYTLNTVDRHVLCVDCRHGAEDSTAQTLTGGNGGRGYSLNQQPVIHRQSGLWRLTPLECERLQGYPDGWTDIGDWADDKGRTRKSSDAARYKALGNSIALPPWKWVLKRISAQFERDATMGSLFDGIGGFPYLWEQINGKGSCLWASEIEPFCVAVTKRRFEK